MRALGRLTHLAMLVVLAMGACFGETGDQSAATQDVRGLRTPTISSGPPATTTATDATFSFSSSGSAVVGYRCRLDLAADTSCTSPQSYAGLSVGSHTFGVRAVDSRGRRSGEATYPWEIQASGGGGGGSGGGLSGQPIAGGWGPRVLSTEGTLDFAHWGYGGDPNAFNHRSGVSAISNVTQVGSGTRIPNSCCLDSFSWTGGAPTASVPSTTGSIFIDSPSPSGAGFRFTVPANTTPATLRIYAGAWAARLRLEATLGDASAPAYVDTSFDVPDGAADVVAYTLDFHAASDGQSLTVTLTIDQNHNTTGDLGEVWLAAATLAGAGTGPGPDTTPPAISAVSATAITSSSATITWTTNEPADSQLDYGTTTSYGTTTPPVTAPVTSHSQSLAGLQAATLYHYRVRSRDAAGNAATSADATFTTHASSGGFTLDLPRVAWEGGPAYWSRFPKASAAGWTAATFFPVAVWLQSAYDAQAFRDLGINVMVGMNHDGANLSTIGASTGMFFIAQDEWTPAEIGTNPKVVGWLASDECDMGYSGCTTDPVAQNQGYVDALRALGDGRFIYANYGKGAIGTWWNPQNMPALVQMVDVASDDLYFFTDPDPDGVTLSAYWPAGAEVRRAASYGWTMTRMWSFLEGAPLHPLWNVVEVGHPFSESWAPTITPDQMEGSTWASLIKEARGLLYFNHSFGGACFSFDVLLDCDPAMRTRFAAMTAKIRQLAPVLNDQSYQWSAASGMSTMLKYVGGSLYLFAQVGQLGSAGTKTLALPGSLNGSAEVMFEGRSVAMTASRLTDTFADTNVVHIYRITP